MTGHRTSVRTRTARWLVPPARTVIERIRPSVAALAIAATAAGLSFALATLAFGAEAGFFAPIAAVICAGLTAGARTRRAIEITVGVVVGLVAADLLVRFFGGGPVQLAVAVALAMTIAVAISGSTLLANQAAVAAVLVIALAPQQPSNPLIRLADALIGASIAIILSLIFGRTAVRGLERVVTGVLRRFGAALGSIADGLRRASLGDLERSLIDLAELNDSRRELEAATRAAHEQSLLWRPERRRAHWIEIRTLTDRLEIMLSTSRAIARAAANSVRGERAVEPEVIMSIDDLALSVENLRGWVTGSVSTEVVRDSALQAGTRASVALVRSPRASTTVLVGQVRSFSIDVLRATGMRQNEAVAALQAAAGSTDAE